MKFIRDIRVHLNFPPALALERRLEKIVRFCSNPKDFSIFCIDPTFNIIYWEHQSYCYHTQKFETKTNRKWSSACFYRTITAISKEDWKTYPRFSNCLFADPRNCSSNVCGTDSEKAVVDGFQRNAPYAIFLRCFIHYKGNIEDYLIGEKNVRQKWRNFSEVTKILSDKKFCLKKILSDKNFDQN